MKSIDLNDNRFLMLFGIVIFSAFFLPYIILGENSYITTHDNLDSDVVWFKTIANSGKLFSFSNNAQLLEVMNGIPRNSMPSAFNFVSILFFLFTPFTAYIINFFLVHIIAFFGMNLLLKEFVFTEYSDKFLRFIISISFAIIPFYGTHSGLAISGLPLLSWCFIHLNSNSRKIHFFIVIFLFSLYSSLLYTGVFALIILSVIWLIQLVFQKELRIWFLLGIVILTLGYVLSELNVITQFLDPDYISHRVERNLTALSFLDALESSRNMFFNGQYHAPTVNSPFITYTSFLGVIMSIIYLVTKKQSREIYAKLVIIIMIVVLLISLFYGVWFSVEFNQLQEKVKILNLIQWNRFHWLLPFLWYILFALSLKVFSFYWKNGRFKIIGSVLVVLQLIKLFGANDELGKNYTKLINNTVMEGSTYKQNPIEKMQVAISFKQFYDEELFASVKNFIGVPQSEYRVISIGLFPEIATYNGFYSLDSYQRNYSLKYKHLFRRVIEGELDKNSSIKMSFDNWGSRCYAFTDELGLNFLVNKKSLKKIKSLDLNFDAFKEMGGRFIISAVEIDTPNQEIFLMKTFESENSYWKIYLYEVIN